MTYPPDDHRDSVRPSPLEHDSRIVNGSMLALAAFVVVAVGIAWYALNNPSRTGTASVSPPAAERSVPDGTVGYGGARPKEAAPKSRTP